MARGTVAHEIGAIRVAREMHVRHGHVSARRHPGIHEDAVPSLPGFGARVTGGSDRQVEVSAKDPENEA